MRTRNWSLFFIVIVIALALQPVLDHFGLVSGELTSVSSTKTAAAAEQPSVESVLIVSVDGLRPDALRQANTPNMDSLWKDGSYTWAAKTVLPSVTLVAHASMLTGVEPARHGIDWNRDSPEKGVIQVPTVFDYAKKAGLTTAMIVGKSKLSHLRRPDVVDYYVHAGYTDVRVGDVASEYLLVSSPNLCFIHFPGPDSAGHAVGWMSDAQIKAIEETDANIGRILSSLRARGTASRCAIIVTADHGGHEKTHGTASDEDMTIPWICWGNGVKKSHLLQGRVGVCDTAATALSALGITPPEAWDGRVVSDAFER
ncbi:MAG: hypothetical protein AUJ92_18990 [Armatimonadetes bacterium CG2_30_59_28]|nr:alkaline phosphatase family protein [Armatimonadota bacterium]OIO90345.1 MAG: hypothetical protein AUJ92_18990 [Armatimonadetes bacterium CG2_30_59_28]PIU62352.1 MAG: hypothetical protein COS85_18690 [Armatimonadetes bacterium CG07_land_8_20_14_0_80_59_28]PIY40806.1 MAG: hypothetical protein COZ05_16690 [Armatimonadetes bacterium CG_4_10_14_3_um_filter_59_10]